MSAASLPTVTDATLPEVLAAGGVVAVEFGAAWCAPCRVMAPVVDAVATELTGRLRIVQMDADASPATAARLGVRGLPTMIVFRDGIELGRIVGAQPKVALRERLERFLTT
jgi:thioredoxin 1